MTVERRQSLVFSQAQVERELQRMRVWADLINQRVAEREGEPTMTLAALIDSVTTNVYLAELETWRAQSESALRANWISLVGQFELQPGIYLVGSNQYAEIRLPAGSAPDHIGVLTVKEGPVSFTPAPTINSFINGAPLKGTATLRSDGDTVRTPDIVTFGSLTFFVIERGARTILRVRDANSSAIANFRGRRWFAADPAYRIVATFTPYHPPKPLAIRNLLGDISSKASPGFVSFTINGIEQRLDAGSWSDDGLLLHFRDMTNGTETYGGGRAVITESVEDGRVVIDFNRTTNLPCAFTPFATCPIPPEQNRLSIPIPAGERVPDSAA